MISKRDGPPTSPRECWSQRTASEYGSSPDAQPALQMRTVGVAGPHISGSTLAAMEAYVSGSRKNFDTLMVNVAINRSYSTGSESRMLAYSWNDDAPFTRIRTEMRLLRQESL